MGGVQYCIDKPKRVSVPRYLHMSRLFNVGGTSSQIESVFLWAHAAFNPELSDKDSCCQVQGGK